ncbi:O-antigen ligase [Actinoplanes sp. N902-109]|uniref:O-antigen ligase family protein n=1 Tax=Actinoplanes sp. (strain N902-109) TaxID=649831 RepID=UPI001E587EBE|nr:O-antigen ligase family protein [Actinoplanes sp. N902-109]
MLARVVLLTYRNRTVDLSKLEPKQIGVLVLAAPFVLLGASGWTERLLFTSPSPTKYVLTVVTPIIAAVVALAPSPFLVFVGAAVFVAPAATLNVSFLGVSFQALVVVCLLAGIPLLLGLTKPVGKSAMAAVLPYLAVLVAIPVARGSEIWEPISIGLYAGALIFLCARAVKLGGGLAVVLGASFSSLLVQAALAIWEFQTHSEFDIYTGTVRSTSGYFFDFQSQPRPTGTFTDPISLGTALVVAIPVGIAVLHLLLLRRKWLAAAGMVASIAVIGVGLALSLSRMASLGAIASLAAVVVFAPRNARLRVAGMAGGLLAVLLAGAIALGGPSLIERASSVSDPTASGVATAEGDRGREYLWSLAWETGLENPVSGVGVGNFSKVLLAHAPGSTASTHAHSVYLQVFSESGLLGLGALALLLGGVTVDLRRARARAPVLTAGLAGAVVALCIAAVTDVVTIKYVAVAATLAPMFGLIAGLAGRDADDRSH